MLETVGIVTNELEKLNHIRMFKLPQAKPINRNDQDFNVLINVSLKIEKLVEIRSITTEENIKT